MKVRIVDKEPDFYCPSCGVSLEVDWRHNDYLPFSNEGQFECPNCKDKHYLYVDCSPRYYVERVHK